MKLISVDVARTTWLFPLSELNPTGRSLTKVFQELAARYNFKKFPNHPEDIDPESKGLVFSQGEFRIQDGQDIIVKLTVFTDGIVADCWSSTTDAEVFLKDAMQWLKKEHGFSLPADRSIKTLYLSQLTVAGKKRLTASLGKLQALADKLSTLTTESGRPNVGFTVAGFSLWAKDWDKPGAPRAYRFEIKVGSSPKEDRYYTVASLPTEAHLAILEEQERLLG